MANNIKRLRLERGFTLDMLAERVNTSKQTIQRYESGTIANIPKERVEAMAEALCVTPAALMGWENAPALSSYNNVFPLHLKKIPLLGRISCGEPILATEEHGGYISTSDRIDADFCLRAQGDSMIGARIYDGDIVFIREQSCVDNGDIAAVIINDEATLKRVYFSPEEQKLVLSPENPRYAPLVFVKDELSDIKILGKAIAFQSVVR